MDVFVIIVCCIFSAFFGAFTTLVISNVTELHHINKDIEELQDKLLQNKIERELITKRIEELEKEVTDE